MWMLDAVADAGLSRQVDYMGKVLACKQGLQSRLILDQQGMAGGDSQRFEAGPPFRDPVINRGGFCGPRLDNPLLPGLPQPPPRGNRGTRPASLHRFPWRGHQLMILPAAPWCDISSGTVQHQQDDMP